MSSDNSSEPLAPPPPNLSPPLSVITATDQRGVVLITTALCLSFSLISVLIRLFIRLEFRHRFARDDAVAMAAMAFSVLQSSTVFVEVSKGFGQIIDDVDPADLVPMQKAAYASDILYILTIWLTKCSVAFLFLRLTPDKRHGMMSNATLALATLLTFISVFIVALRCDLARPWIYIDAACTNLFTRWQVVAAFDTFTEVALLSIAIYIVKGLQLSLAKKSLVIIAFGLRLPVIAPIILRLSCLNTAISSGDPTLDGVLANVFTQIQISYAIIAATTPCLRPFMIALSTNYGAPAPVTAKSSPAATGLSRSDKDISLASLSRRPEATPGAAPRAKRPAAPTNRWDVSEHHAEITSGDQQSVGSHDSKQMIISKNTEWAVEYNGR